MQLRGSHLVSLAILAAIGGWMLTGKVIVGGTSDNKAPTIKEREAKRQSAAFRVRVTRLEPTERLSVLDIRGRTQADARISVRAETGGTVKSRPAKKGQMVKAGELLCVIDQGVRDTSLAQAKAQLEQAQADYDANDKLVKRGFATKSKLRSLKAALDSAKAVVATAEQELTRTEIRATTSGMVQEPLAEVGDNLSPGAVCVTLLDADPMLFTGQVSERDIASVEKGMKAKISLVDSEVVEGTISYISPVADPQTRTFTVEIALPNADFEIRDGLTASANIALTPTVAYQVEPSWLTLDDEGRVGVRAVGRDKVVSFHPVKILTQDVKLMWVSGLKPGLDVITLGQNYVSAGETVAPVTAAEMEALEKATEASKPEISS